MLTIDKLKTLALDPKLAKHAARVLTAQTIAETTRKRVDGYVAIVFAHFEFHVSHRFLRSATAAGERITCPGDLYLCEDESMLAEFYRLCDLAHEQAGYRMPKGFCPALCAENHQMRMERRLLEYVDERLGTPFVHCYGEKLKTILNIVEGLALKNPATEKISRRLLPRTQVAVSRFITRTIPDPKPCPVS